MSVFIDEDLLVLRRTSPWNFKSLALDGPMLAILDRIDGIRPLGRILREVAVSRDRQETAVIRLLEYDLVEIRNLEHVLAKPLETGRTGATAASL